MRGCVIVSQALLKIGLTFGVGKRSSGLVFLGNSRIRFALQLMQYLIEASYLVEIIRYPQGEIAGLLVPGHEARAPIGGHAQADKIVLLKRGKMRSPGLSRPISSELNVEDGGAVRINRDQNGLIKRENLIAEIKHPGLGWHRQRGRYCLPCLVAELTERADSIGGVVQGFENGCDTQEGTFAFQPQQEQEVFVV